MKSIFGLYLIGLVSMLHWIHHDARPQYFQQPWKYFENMTFDMENRGTYNMSHCMENMINCWEIVKPDMICSWFRYYSSVCSLMRDHCSEFTGGDQDKYPHFSMGEGWCYNWKQLYLT